MDLATRDSNAAAMLDRLIRNLPREQDRKTFDGWSLEARTVAESDDNRVAPSHPSGPDGAA